MIPKDINEWESYLLCDYATLTNMSQISSYKIFRIIKRNGCERTILAPKSALIDKQLLVYQVLKSVYRVPDCVHGYTEGRSVITNAKRHIKKRYIINIDIENFFDSITTERVTGLFSKVLAIDYATANMIARLCTVLGTLPQGAPTSPIISNMIFLKADIALMGLAKINNLCYTRYSDDITISSAYKFYGKDVYDSSMSCLSTNMVNIFRANGFTINSKKTKLLSRNVRQTVTGIIVNKKLNLRNSYFKLLRAVFFSIERNGLDVAATKFFEGSGYTNKKNRDTKNEDFMSVILGKIGYIKQVCGEDDKRYLKYYDMYKKVENISGPRIENRHHNLPLDVRYANGVMLITLEYGDSNCSQGTCFYLSGVGIVTCYHIFDFLKKKPGALVGYCFEVCNHIGIVIAKAKIIKEDRDRDYVVAEIDLELVEGGISIFQRNDTVLKSRDAVTICGYPNYGPGKTISTIVDNITSFYTNHTIKYLIVSKNLQGGISGGPVFCYGTDKVVGIAVKGDYFTTGEGGELRNTGENKVLRLEEIG